MRFYRNGMLVTETLGIVIAIIALVALGFLGVKLYSMFVSADLKNAQAFIDDISAKIENLEDGQSNTFAMRGVKEWVLVGWNKSIPIVADNELISESKKPQKCFDKHCLCLCKDSVANCQEIGYCRAVDRNVSVSSKLESLVYFRDIEYKFEIVTSYCILQTDKLMGFFVDKKQEGILIYHDYGRQDQIAGEKEILAGKICVANKL